MSSIDRRTFMISMLAVAIAACGSKSGSPPAAHHVRIQDELAASGSHPAATAIGINDGTAITPAEADIELTTSDGVTLAATYIAGPEGKGGDRCVVMLHQLGSTRAEWKPLVDALRGRYHLLTLDMRGHGDSTKGANNTKLDWHAFSDDDWKNVALDLAAARDFFASMQISSANCVYVGSSIGSSAVLRFAGKYIDAAGIVLLSPGLA